MKKVVLSILESRNGFNAKVKNATAMSEITYSCDNLSYMQNTLAMIINISDVYLVSYSFKKGKFTIAAY